jgi:hypothetical protein
MRALNASRQLPAKLQPDVAGVALDVAAGIRRHVEEADAAEGVDLPAIADTKVNTTLRAVEEQSLAFIVKERNGVAGVANGCIDRDPRVTRGQADSPGGVVERVCR